MNDRFVRTGVFLAPFHALPENPLLCLERDMELLIHLDRLNYHEAWIGEHHSGGFELIATRRMHRQARRKLCVTIVEHHAPGIVQPRRYPRSRTNGTGMDNACSARWHRRVHAPGDETVLSESGRNCRRGRNVDGSG